MSNKDMVIAVTIVLLSAIAGAVIILAQPSSKEVVLRYLVVVGGALALLVRWLVRRSKNGPGQKDGS